MRKLFLIYTLLLISISYSQKITNFYSVEKSFCDSIECGLFIRIFNNSKYDISDFNMATDSLTIIFDDIKPKKTTCYKSISPFNRDCPYYFICSYKKYKNKDVKRFGCGGNNIGDKVSSKCYTSGYYTLVVTIRNKNSYPIFDLIKD